jgi:small GTP-binding protein
MNQFNGNLAAQNGISNSSSEPIILKFKICLLGDGAVGKTSLIRRFVEDAFRDDYLLTIGTKTSKKRVIIKKPEFQKDLNITLIIWDIMGQISFRKLLHPTYLKGARGAILVCDLTRKETLEHLDDWIDSLYVEGKVVPSVFVGNKCDLVDNHAFGKAELESVASAYDSPFYITSAKTGEFVEEAFRTLSMRIITEMAKVDPIFATSIGQKVTESVAASNPDY